MTQFTTVHGHGQSVGAKASPTYVSWASMKNRCLSPSAGNYKNYGAKGVVVCERWMKFENFLADMGPRPIGTSIDRIDSTKGYEPRNCRWATRSEQNKNRRSWTHKK